MRRNQARLRGEWVGAMGEGFVELAVDAESFERGVQPALTATIDEAATLLGVAGPAG